MSVLGNRRLVPRRPAAARRERRPERGVVVLIRTLLMFESTMYAVVTPVLPHYARILHAGKPAIGVLAAAYAAGIIPGSLLAGWLATRVGVRRTTVAGLLVFAASIFAFGFGTDIIALDALRFVQGVACGLIWGGGLTWVISMAAREHRGEVIGSVLAGAIFGTLLGPVVGTLAVAAGTELMFSLVGAVSLVLAAWTVRFPDPPRSEARTRTPIRSLVANRRIMLGAWLILLEAGTLGATGTLLPLRLSRFGASGVAIGLIFLLTALGSTFLATPFGRITDRRGAGPLLIAGLTATAVLLALLPLPQSALALGVLSIITLGGPLTAYTIPAMSVITDSADRVGIPLAVATMLLNLAWATGETIGAPAAASLSEATSDTVPLLLLSAIMVLTLIPVRRARLRPDPSRADHAVSHGAPATEAPETERVPVAS